MSHELRTPLNAIIGFSELLRQKEALRLSAEQQAGYAKDILDSGSHLLSIINDILDLSRIDAGAVQLDETAVAVPQLVENVLRLMRPRALAAGVHVDVVLPDDMPVLRADERQLKQILFNLLSNSIKFTPQGGHVRVSGQRSAEGVALSVSDNGIGIARENLARVLEPFGQGIRNGTAAPASDCPVRGSSPSSTAVAWRSTVRPAKAPRSLCICRLIASSRRRSARWPETAPGGGRDPSSRRVENAVGIDRRRGILASARMRVGIFFACG